VSKASDGAPPRRTDEADVPTEGTPVKVNRLESGSMLGIIRYRLEYDYDDAPARLVVEGRDKTVNTSADRVDVATGKHADLVKDMLGDDEDV